MTMTARHLEKDAEFSGTIPEGAVRLILSLGVQGQGEVTIGSGDPQHLFYGKNEYVTGGETSYTMKSAEPLDVVEEFVFMPPTIDAYMEQKFAELAGPYKTKLDDHETRITALENRPGPPATP